MKRKRKEVTELNNIETIPIEIKKIILNYLSKKKRQNTITLIFKQW